MDMDSRNFGRPLRQPIKKRVLLIVDEAHGLTDEDLTYLQYLHERHGQLAVILIDQRVGDIDQKEVSTLDLGGLTKAEFMKLLRKRMASFRPDVADRFFEFVYT